MRDWKGLSETYFHEMCSRFEHYHCFVIVFVIVLSESQLFVYQRVVSRDDKFLKTDFSLTCWFITEKIAHLSQNKMRLPIGHLSKI